jgi:hypothetical protein
MLILGHESRHLHRRPSAWSSDSQYSDDISDGIIESDEEAKELLARADSGPAPLKTGGEEVEEKDEPSNAMVDRAREMMKRPLG